MTGQELAVSLSAAEREAALARLKEFAGQQRGADELADKGSLDRAADIVALYEDRSWVAELGPLKVTRHMGRPVDPESFSRFTKWLADKAPITGTHAYRLRDANALVTTYFTNGELSPRGEFELRPLKWLTKNGYEERVPDVWREACRLAGGTPDGPTVRQALKQWKKDNLPKSESKGRPRGADALVEQWLREARTLMEQYPEMFIIAVDRLDDQAEEFFTHREAAAAA